VSEKLNLPLAIFVVETMCLVVLTTLGLMTTTLVAISTVALIAFTWNQGKTIQARTRRDRHLHQ